jgi:hypothetical protein
MPRIVSHRSNAGILYDWIWRVLRRRSLGYWRLKLGDIQRFSFVISNFNVPSLAGPNAGFCNRYQLAGAFPLHRLLLFCRDYSINQLTTPQHSSRNFLN